MSDAHVSGESVDPPAEITAAPARPLPVPLPTDNPKRAKLVKNVRDALNAIPLYFQSATSIEGLEAGDLFSLNGVLGGTIEIQTVATLNKIRHQQALEELERTGATCLYEAVAVAA